MFVAPHPILTKLRATHLVNLAQKFETRIFFPRLYNQQSARYGNISITQTKAFIDKVFFPAADNAFHDAEKLRMSKCYQHAASKGYTTNASFDFMSHRDLCSTISQMRVIVNTATSLEMQQFRGFYFVTSSFGGKQDYHLFVESVNRADFNLKPKDLVDLGFDYTISKRG
ncbi:hypothetical protein MBANPS3_011996 [Mucor bainieri]